MRKIALNTIFKKTAVLGFLLFRLFAVNAEDISENSLLPLSSQTSYTGQERVLVNLADLSEDESTHYAFLYGYQAMLQKRCNGALLTFDENDNYITGYLTPDAPDDFCTRLSAQTIVVCEPVTSDTMMYMYAVFGDRSSISILLDRKDKAYVAVIMFEPVDNMVLTPMWYSEAETKINNEAVARGINPEEVYTYHQENGFDKDTIVAFVADGYLDASTIVVDAIKLKNASKDISSFFEKLGVTSNSLVQVIILAAIAGGALIFIYLIVRIFVKHTTPPFADDDDEIEETEDPEN